MPSITPRVRGVLVAVALLLGVGVATSCTPEEIALWNSLSHDQQLAVGRAINGETDPGDCRGAAHAVFPAHLHGWTDKIISRESGGNPAAQNRSSSAAGCFQIIQGTWNANAACSWSMRYNAMCNARTAWNIYQRSGGSPWVTNY